MNHVPNLLATAIDKKEREKWKLQCESAQEKVAIVHGTWKEHKDHSVSLLMSK